MFFKPPPEPPPPRTTKQEADAESGLVARVKAASGHGAPAPASRQLVIMLMVVVVAGALIYQFSAGGRSSRPSPQEGGPVLAPEAPPGQPDATAHAPAAARTAVSAGPFHFAMDVGAARPVRVDVEGAVALVLGAPQAERRALRSAALRGLLDAARSNEAARALEGAAWLLEDAGELDLALLGALAEVAHRALEDDRAAFGALRVLEQLPDHGGLLVISALDRLIQNNARPLSLRVEAARVRPRQGRPAELDALEQSASVHPALRAALSPQGEPTRR